MAEEKKNFTGFSKEEQAAMRQRAKEIAAEAKAQRNKEAREKMILDAIDAMSEPDKSIAKKIHEIVKKVDPGIWCKTWYGFPAYTTPTGNVICFYQPGEKFKYRYGTLGFQQDAKLDEGTMWPNAYAITKITAKEEAEIAELVKKALGK